MANFTKDLPVLMITLIANILGIAGGLLFYIIIKRSAGMWREVPAGFYLLATPRVYYFHR